MRFQVPLEFIIQGSVEVSADPTASDKEIARLAEEKGADLAEKMMERLATSSSASVLPVRPLRIRVAPGSSSRKSTRR